MVQCAFVVAWGFHVDFGSRLQLLHSVQCQTDYPMPECSYSGCSPAIAMQCESCGITACCRLMFVAERNDSPKVR